MSTRPRKNREFGRYLEGLRLARKTSSGKPWTKSDAERFAQSAGLPLSRQIILNAENGQTQKFRPEVLHALADLYEVPYSELLRRSHTLQPFGIDRDLPGPSPEVERREREVIDAIRSAKESEARYKQLRDDMQRIANAMFQVLTNHKNGKSARVSTAARKAKGRPPATA